MTSSLSVLGRHIQVSSLLEDDGHVIEEEFRQLLLGCGFCVCLLQDQQIKAVLCFFRSCDFCYLLHEFYLYASLNQYRSGGLSGVSDMSMLVEDNTQVTDKTLRPTRVLSYSRLQKSVRVLKLRYNLEVQVVFCGVQ